MSLSADRHVDPAFQLAASRLIAQPGRLKSDCTIILGGAGETWENSRRHLDAMAGEVASGGISIASVPPEARKQWFDDLVIHLSHNAPLDVALCRAARDVGTKAPLPLLSRELARDGRIEMYTKRLGDYLKLSIPERTVKVPHAVRFRLPEVASTRKIGEILGETALAYLSESGDASKIAEAREKLEEELGPILVSPLGERAQLPHAIQRDVERR
jgi:hypothetical protein